MKCARLHLQERSKVKIKPDSSTPIEKPRRYCQKRLVNPNHEEDPRWMDIWDRFHCNLGQDENCDTTDGARVQQDIERMVLTVQTLKFQGDVDQTKRQRTSFKYKNITGENKHRMFIKEIIPENEHNDEDISSQLTHYYLDDYIKYLCNSDRSRPTSSKSSLLHKCATTKDIKENKAIQVESLQADCNKKVQPKPKKILLSKQCLKQEVKKEDNDLTNTIDNTKISYQNTGRRKSLTISRTQSPETLQIIRVDVVCNHSSSSILSEYEESKKSKVAPMKLTSKLENFNVKNHFANKYLLTKSIKTLDESLRGGSKVTLLCKTFRLSDRFSKQYDKPYVEKNRHTPSFKEFKINDIQVKSRK